ncbi:MAG: mismatch repair protein MutS, partial [Pseudomonadota bacterium]
IRQARERLRQLEQHSVNTQRATAAASTTAPLQADLFAAAPGHPALDMIRTLNPDELSAREALNLLYRLKALTDGE